MCDDVIDPEIEDKDAVEPEVLAQKFSKRYSLLSETAVSGKSTYINKLHGSKSLKLAVSLGNNSLEIYELQNCSLTRICKLSGHNKTVKDVVMCPKDDNLVYSAGLDGVVKLWDIRTSGKNVQEYQDDDEVVTKQYECMDVSCNGQLICAGSVEVHNDSYVVFWDNRNVQALGGYWNSHSNDIVQVKFHKKKVEVVATGAEDGLVNIYNILETNEDDALLYSLNTELSVEKLSWLDEKQLACTTQSNDLQVWDVESGDMLKSFSRDKIAKKMMRTKSDDCYLVDVFTEADNTPVVLGGSYGGNGDVLRSVTITEGKLQPHTNFSKNMQTVKACWYNKQRDLLVTAGDSGRICAWSACTGDEAGGEAGPASAPKSQSKAHKTRAARHKPY